MSERATYTEHVYQEYCCRSFVDPLHQREEIVRCKDCGYYQLNIYRNVTCELFMCHVEPNDFCSQAERKDEHE